MALAMHDQRTLSRYIDAVADLVRPPPDRTADQWADACRILPADSPEPGPWRSSRVPYMVPIMRAFSDPRYRTVVVVAGAQMAKTECIFNIFGHRFSDGPYMPALYVGPTEKQVRSISNDRFAKMLRSTPILAARLEGGHRDKVTEKYLAGVRLGFAWAGSATELASHPVGLVLVDERDRMIADVDGEGDPVELARARLKNYPRGVLGVFSTPTIEGASAIWSLYEEGTMCAWSWPCPHCREFFVPRLDLLRWPADATPQEALAHGVLACPSCGAEITSEHKPSMNAAGAYQPHALGDDGEHVPVAEPAINTTASYWVSGLASPWRTFGQAAEIMVRAYRSREPERVQAAINTEMGELYRIRGDAPAWHDVAARKSGYAPGSIPDGVRMLTCGVDVQKRGLYYVVRGWGFNSESWLIRHAYIPGETEYDSVWLLIASVYAELYQHAGEQMHVSRVFVDSGYRPGDRWRRPENQVYVHARRHHGLVFPTKGHETQDRPIKASDIDVSIAGRVLKGGVKLFHLDTDYLKTWIHSRIRWPSGEPGGWHLHADTDEDYCRQIVSEELVVKPSGRRIWLRRAKDNHYLDAEANALAAAITLQVHALPRTQSTQQSTQQSTPQATPQATPQRFVPRAQGSWFRRR